MLGNEEWLRPKGTRLLKGERGKGKGGKSFLSARRGRSAEHSLFADASDPLEAWLLTGFLLVSPLAGLPRRRRHAPAAPLGCVYMLVAFSASHRSLSPLAAGALPLPRGAFWPPAGAPVSSGPGCRCPLLLPPPRSLPSLLSRGRARSARGLPRFRALALGLACWLSLLPPLPLFSAAFCLGDWH